MDNLLTKSYNSYLKLLTNMNYGKTEENYCLLYDSILCLKNNITDTKYIQYFINNIN